MPIDEIIKRALESYAMSLDKTEGSNFYLGQFVAYSDLLKTQGYEFDRKNECLYLIYPNGAYKVYAPCFIYEQGIYRMEEIRRY